MGNIKGNKAYVSSPKARAMMRNLATNMRALRQEYGWTLKELGEATGIGARAIENWEAEITAPSFVAVCWLAEAFDVTLNQLIFYPREAFEGRMRNAQNGRFVVPDATRACRNRDTSSKACADGTPGAVHPTKVDPGE